MGKKITILAIAFAIVAFTQPAYTQQAGKVYRIGVIRSGTPKTHPLLVKWLRQGLRELGYVEGRNIIFEIRFAMRKRDRLLILAKELVGMKVDVIVVTGVRAAKDTQKATSSIPIVVATASDLVGSGVIASLARPGGNITGNTAYSEALGGKQLQFLKETIPQLGRVAILYGSKKSVTWFKQVKVDGRAAGVEIQEILVRDEGDFDSAFAAMAKARAGALILVVSRLTSGYRRDLIKLATKWKLPTMCWRPSMARAGCLMSYGADRNAMYRRVAVFVDKILKGAKPADLPVQRPTKFNLVINLKTAKALGITIPRTILLRADKVIQ